MTEKPKPPFRPKSYQIKPDRIQAVQLTTDNVEQVADWCGGEIFKDPMVLMVPSLQNRLTGRVQADIGYWVVKNSEGRFSVYDDAAFKQKYERSGIRVEAGEPIQAVFNFNNPSNPPGAAAAAEVSRQLSADPRLRHRLGG